MYTYIDGKINPNPITKFIVVGILGFTVLHPIDPHFEWMTIIVLSVFFYLNGLKKDAVINIVFFSVLFFMPSFMKIEKFPIVLKMIFSLLFVLRMFYMPFIAGKFLIKTSDVGSILASLDKLKVPSCVSIPIAIIFRYFPSFREERRNIKWAMKVRGIQTKNPVRYLEYVFVPLLVISSNIADDISRAAETRCISNPTKKRYTEVYINVADIVYAVTILILVIGGRMWLK